jgi:segregation and condensation protein B
LYATTRHFLDDLGLSSLDQLPLLQNVEGQAAVLASLNSPQEDSAQATLSLDEAIEVAVTSEKSLLDAESIEISESPEVSILEIPETSEGKTHE